MPVPLNPPLVAKNGRKLKVLGIARISTEHQDELSLDDQQSLYEHWLAINNDLPYDLTMIAGRGSGESLRRKEVLQAEDEIHKGIYDLVIAEDLGRIFRRVQAFVFCESCEDFGTRVIAINDHVDTGAERWRLNAFFAAIRHEMYNADTGKRIRRTLRHRFDNGGVFQFAIAGYIKPENAKSELDVYKDPAAGPIYDEWFRRLEQEESFADIADWLNKLGFATGPHCKNDKWDGRMVARVTYNPILKGLRVRNEKMSKRINSTGERRSIKAPPEERLERECPHLAFIEPTRYDRVIRMLEKRNACYRRKGSDGVDTRKNVSKKSTTWPGQHLVCGVCGRIYYWTGVADKKMMMCSGSHIYRCWNSVHIDGEFVAWKLSQGILTEIRTLPGFNDSLFNDIQLKLKQSRNKQQNQSMKLKKKCQEIALKIDNLTQYLASGLGTHSLLKKIQAFEQEQDDIQHALDELQQAPSEIVIPTLEQIQEAAERSLNTFVPDSPETARLMRKLVPNMQVFPYRLCDGGAIVLRAKLTVFLPALLPNASAFQGVETVLQQELIVDLFEPPQRVRFRKQVVQMRADGMTEQRVASALGITKTAAQRAAALDRLMREQGIDDPYVPVLSPPQDYGKLRRHKHPRYRFEPLQEQ